MSEQTGKYRIEFETVKTGTGAEKTAEDLKKVAAQAKETGEKLRDAQGRFLPKDATPEMIAAAQAAKEVGKSTETGAEGMKLFGKHTHEAHAALHVLNDAIPGFAQMARFLSNTLTATMGVGALAITFLKGKLDAMKEALDSLQTSPGARGEWAEKLAEKAEESAVAFDVWKDKIDRIAKALQTLDQLTDRSISQDREHIGTQKAIGDAQKELEEARLDLAVKIGQVTPEQAIKIRLKIDDDAFKRDLEVKAAEIQAEIETRTREARWNHGLISQKADEVTQTKGAADASAAAKIKNDEKLAQDKKNLEASIEAQKKAQEIVESLEGKGMWGGKWDKSDPQYWTLKTAKETVESEGRRQGGLKSAIGQEEGKKEDLDTAAETSKAAYDAAKTKYEDALKLENELKVKLASLAQDLAAEKAKNTALENLHHQTGAVKAESQGIDESHAAVANAKEVERRFFEGHAGPSEVHAALLRLTAIINAHLNMTTADRAALTQANANISDLESAISASLGH